MSAASLKFPVSKHTKEELRDDLNDLWTGTHPACWGAQRYEKKLAGAVSNSVTKLLPKFQVAPAQPAPAPALPEPKETPVATKHTVSVPEDGEKVEKQKRNLWASRLAMPTSANGQAHAMQLFVDTNFGRTIDELEEWTGQNCVFASVLQQLGDVPEDYNSTHFRLATVDYCIDNIQDINKELALDILGTPQQNIKAWCAGMVKNGTSCDNLGVKIIRRMLGIPMATVFPLEVQKATRSARGNQKTFSAYIEYHDNADLNVPLVEIPIVLAYNGTNHYAPCIPTAAAKVGQLLVSATCSNDEVVGNLDKILAVCPEGDINIVCSEIRELADRGAALLRTVSVTRGTANTALVTEARQASGKKQTPPSPAKKDSTSSRKRKLIKPTGGPMEMDANRSTPPTQKKPRDNQCPCGIQCRDPDDFKVHKDTHPPWECSYPECKKICASDRAVWKHFRTIHFKLYLHNCPHKDCSYGTEELGILQNHRIHEHGCKFQLEERCKKCLKPFTTARGQKNHRCGEDVVKKPCPEEGCAHKFNSERRLREHLKTHGPDGAQFVCDICGIKCSSGNSLKQHQGRHGVAQPELLSETEVEEGEGDVSKRAKTTTSAGKKPVAKKVAGKKPIAKKVAASKKVPVKARSVKKKSSSSSDSSKASKGAPKGKGKKVSKRVSSSGTADSSEDSSSSEDGESSSEDEDGSSSSSEDGSDDGSRQSGSSDDTPPPKKKTKKT